MKYSIVIPTYNHCDDLLKPCIDSILKYSTLEDLEIIVSANGCTDNTFEYLGSLKEKFNYLGFNKNLKIVWNNEPLGYSRATNEGIKVATNDLIVLLNNDVLLLEQSKNIWLKMLEEQFTNDPMCGVSCVIKGPSEPAGRDFAVFFCVMIHRKVFNRIGLLNQEYGVGGGEDTEFCIEAENAGFKILEATPKSWSDNNMLYVGNFPIYHKGEGTMHDSTLVPNWNNIFLENSYRLAKKYNPKWYQWKISNNSERAVFFKGDVIFPREQRRYQFAANNLLGSNVLEIGCSSGYGVQFLPDNINYTGLDIDKEVISAAISQNWKPNLNFVAQDINEYLKSTPDLKLDTVIAFETIEHIPNGFEVLDRLKQISKRIILTVPYNENINQYSSHHRLHNLTIDKFKGFTEIGVIDLDGNILTSSNVNPLIEHSLLMVWDSTTEQIVPVEANFTEIDYKEKLKFLTNTHEEIYREVVQDNCYNANVEEIKDSIIVDIGANIGSYSLLTHLMKAKKILAVEPVKSTYEYLCKNIETLGATNIVPVKKIVTNQSGNFCKISLNENSGHNSMYNVTAEKDYELVETITLKDLFNEAEISNDQNIILKLDCEGAEYDILLSSSKELLSRVKKVILEIHMDLHPVYKGHEILDNKLTEFGFVQEDVKQIFSWFVDEKGNVFDMKPIPYRIEIWKR